MCVPQEPSVACSTKIALEWDETFKNLNDDIKLNIRIDDNTSPNDLLSFLTAKAEVHHFVEVIPSASDIFIQTVKNN